MRSPVSDYLDEVLRDLASDTDGEVALADADRPEADPDVFGIALTTADGRTYGSGDDEVEFSIQSIAKPFAYAAALADRGSDGVHAKVGVEPSGESFDELSLEDDSGRPRNPMINAGAIAVHSVLLGDDAAPQARFDHLLAFFSRLAGRELAFDEALYEAEAAEADRNLAIAHLLRSHGIFSRSARETVDSYLRQSAILVTVRDLAAMGATLAHGGVQPVSGERLLPHWIARQTMSVMAGCGMYDGSGEWLAAVGIPAKSGISGGVLGSLPGQCGIGVVSPRLDPQGNSERGIKVFERLSKDLDLHLMAVEDYGRTVLREVRRDGDTVTFDLAGELRFDGAEFVLHALVGDTAEAQQVVIDLARVGHVSEVAGRLLAQGARRLRAEGRTVTVEDPDGLLGEPSE